MKTYHNKPTYEYNNKTYLKIGAYGIDDLEYKVQSDGSICLPEVDRYYSSLENAYSFENQKWIDNEDKIIKELI